jgi:lysophospholipase L1-like esterase
VAAFTQTDVSGSLVPVSSHVEAAQVFVTDELRGQTYVALGDSISAGYDVPGVDVAFPALLARDLGMSLHLIARSGTRAAWGVAQVPAVTAERPRLVTIELGTNDVGFLTPADVFAQQYEAIVSGVSNPNTQVVCIDSWLPSPPFRAIIRDTCLRHGGTFVSLEGFYSDDDFHAQDGGPSVRGPNRADWFHPGTVGHLAIAEAVAAALQIDRPAAIGPRPGPLVRTALGARRE